MAPKQPTTTIASEPVKLVTAERINVYLAYRMDETGIGYSWQSWGSDTRDYKAEETEVILAIPSSAEITQSNAGEWLMYWQGRPYTAQEAVDSHLAIEQGEGLGPDCDDPDEDTSERLGL